VWRGVRTTFVTVGFGILGAIGGGTIGALLLANAAEMGFVFGLFIGVPPGAIVGVVLGILASRSFNRYDAAQESTTSSPPRD
jgi:hypothetical protein